MFIPVAANRSPVPCVLPYGTSNLHKTILSFRFHVVGSITERTQKGIMAKKERKIVE